MADQDKWTRENSFSVATLVVALIVACIAAFTFEQTRRQADAAFEANRRSKPANFRLGLVTVLDLTRNTEITTFHSGRNLVVQAKLINFGNETGLPDDDACLVYWHKGKLPMTPAVYEHPVTCKGTWPLKGVAPGAPGSIYLIDAPTTVPEDYDADTHLYFIGFKRYHDSVSKYLFVLFGREFDPERNRFVPIDNPDYDSEASR